MARREALLHAAVEVVAEHGVAGVTHRAVTEKAGMPLATVSYFFASIDDLAVEALRGFTAREVSQLHALAARVAEERRTPGEIATAFADASAPEWPATPAQFETYLHAARSPALRDAVRDSIAAYREVAVAALRAVGARHPEDTAAAFIALSDGFAMQRLAQPDSVDAEAVRRAFRALSLGGWWSPARSTAPSRSRARQIDTPHERHDDTG